MACKNSISTKSGTFTFFNELVTKCVAEKKCKKRGEILAPVTNKRDAKKLMALLDSNYMHEDCPFVQWYGQNYWLGLDVTYTESEQSKVFSNGAKWKAGKHGKIYHDILEGYRRHSECAAAFFEPVDRKDPFIILDASMDCDGSAKNWYICLKPAGKATAEALEEGDFVGDGAFVLPSGAVGVFIFAVGLIAGVVLQKRNGSGKNAETGKACVIGDSCVSGTTVVKGV